MKQYVDYLKDVKVVDRSKVLILMVYDSFREHLEESVKQKFHDCRFDLAIIPGGLTSLCQPLDVSINKLFKNNLRKEWHLWMAASDIRQTAAGNLRQAKLGNVCEWVKHS